jgi:hypothetical protein
MTALLGRETAPAAAPPVCDVPIDSLYFDDSSVVPIPPPGAELVLARFELPNGYCGLLEYFAQFTDFQAANPAEIRTPNLRWQLLLNRQPLAPYLNLEHIVNPWGFGAFAVAIRVPTSARLELVLRRSAVDTSNPVQLVGGRIMGRYWYRGR